MAIRVDGRHCDWNLYVADFDHRRRPADYRFTVDRAHNYHQPCRCGQIHKSRGLTAERRPTQRVPKATKPADDLLLQDTPQPRSRFCHVCGLRQLLLADPQAGKSDQKRPAACIMAGLAGHV